MRYFTCELCKELKKTDGEPIFHNGSTDEDDCYSFCDPCLEIMLAFFGLLEINKEE